MIVHALIAAAFYGGSVYLYNWRKAETPEPFSYTKFGSTMILGLIVGLFSMYFNLPLDQTSITNQVVEYGLLVAVIENTGKAVWMWLQERLGKLTIHRK